MNVSGEVDVGEVCSTVSLSGWHVTYDKVAHHCCSLCIFLIGLKTEESRRRSEGGRKDVKWSVGNN